MKKISKIETESFNNKIKNDYISKMKDLKILLTNKWSIANKNNIFENKIWFYNVT